MALVIKRILLPTDFSAYSATATQYACELAAKFESIRYQWKFRHHNAVADKLVRIARKRRGEVHDVDEG